ncbi:MAG: hypothetical protein ACREOW_10780 [Thermodesulfobacteriota bacterium]
MYDPNLEETYEKLKATDPRRAAEVAYVLAVINKQNRNLEKARLFAIKSIELFQSLDIRTLEDAAARFVVLNNVALPSYIHEDVVRERLKDVLEG